MTRSALRTAAASENLDSGRAGIFNQPTVVLREPSKSALVGALKRRDPADPQKPAQPAETKPAKRPRCGSFQWDF